MPSQPSMQQQRHHKPSMQQQQRQQQPSMLQAPRPATLKVTNDSKADDRGLKRRRPPVIIYVESPKVVHAHPGEFKSVVQRLTGAPPSSASSSAPPLQFPFHWHLPGGSSPPAADAAAGGVRSGLGFFRSDGDQLMSPAAAFLYDHNQTSMVQAANASLVVPPSLGASLYHRHHGDLFVNQLQ